MGADMSRNKNLAGQSVKQGGYTVTYDKNGYAKKAVKDGGASAAAYARKIMPDWGGVGLYKAQGFTHIDVREDRSDWNG